MALREKAGRAEIPIDWERVEELLICGCSGLEVASNLGIHHDTLYNRVQKEYGVVFSEYSSKFKQKGESILRETQFNKAIGKAPTADNTMLVWLGKNRLQQKETHETPVAPNDAHLNDLIANIKTLSGKLDSIKQEKT